MDKIPERTENLAAENAAKLLKLFPECAGERGEVDFDKLKQALADHALEGDVERYQFTWPGKRAAMAAANVPTTKTLAPCEAESVDFATTQNLYVEGDNLEALKILRAAYLGQVKMIYIDPPYNTGHDFVYHDRFAISQEEADQRGGNVDELGRRFTENGESNPRFHSDWCSMMYPRLKLARDLLRDDGVIFISIDDTELANVRKLCDVMFGEEHFIGILIWKTKTAAKGVPTTNMLVTNHDYVLVYERGTFRFRGENRNVSSFSNPDNDPRGPWKADNMKSTVSTNIFEIVDPNTGHRFSKNWAFSQESIQRMIAEDKIIWPEDEMGTPRQKRFLSEMTNETTPLRTLIGEFQSETATNKLKELFGGVKVFDFPKSVDLLKVICEQGLTGSEVVLDFFSGSATTAHAVMQLNAEDGGNRKFILVQLPEPCSEGSEAAKAGYKNICEIGKERIRRAGRKIKDENATTAPHLDVGFRVLKVVDSPMIDASKPAAETKQTELAFSSIKEGVTDDALLFHVMLRLGIAPADAIERRTIEGNKVACVGGVRLVAALDAQTQMTNAFIEAVANMHPGIAVFRDDVFRNNNALRISLEQTFKQLSQETKVEVI